VATCRRVEPRGSIRSRRRALNESFMRQGGDVVELTMMSDILDSRDWVLRVLVRRQRLRLQLGGADGAAHEQDPAMGIRAGDTPQTRSLAALAAMAEQLCARGTAVGPQCRG
jgi:hypothetical protein